MNNQFLEFLYKWPKSYISGLDLINHLDSTPNSRFSLIKRAVNEGYLIRLKKDFFLIKIQLEKKPLNLFEIAPVIYGPSYISFESALSFYGWIPEGVKTITCACIKKSKEFESPLGVFSYKKIPENIFPIGIRQYKKTGCNLFIADPFKALCDYVYINKKNWSNINEICDDMRIEKENFESLNKDLLSELRNYPNERVKKTVKILQKELK